jgi:hypothetical protein
VIDLSFLTANVIWAIRKSWLGVLPVIAALRRAALSDRTLLDKVERVCRPCVSDPYAQRHHFWMH